MGLARLRQLGSARPGIIVLQGRLRERVRHVLLGIIVHGVVGRSANAQQATTKIQIMRSTANGVRVEISALEGIK